MKILRFIFLLCSSLGFIVSLVIISWVITSLSYYNHDVGEEKEYLERSVFFEKQVSFCINSDKYVEIEIGDQKRQPDKILVAYALDFYDKYHLPVYLYDYASPFRNVIVSSEGNISIIYQ